ncbi:MAG: hypothetical protein WEE89_02420 [Gemmatimonadota bacterium]
MLTPLDARAWGRSWLDDLAELSLWAGGHPGDESVRLGRAKDHAGNFPHPQAPPVL